MRKFKITLKIDYHFRFLRYPNMKNKAEKKEAVMSYLGSLGCC